MSTEQSWGQRYILSHSKHSKTIALYSGSKTVIHLTLLKFRPRPVSPVTSSLLHSPLHRHFSLSTQLHPEADMIFINASWSSWNQQHSQSSKEDLQNKEKLEAQNTHSFNFPPANRRPHNHDDHLQEDNKLSVVLQQKVHCDVLNSKRTTFTQKPKL
jgi:hypothetical protein